jgi:hypothetical protein
MPTGIFGQTIYEPLTGKQLRLFPELEFDRRRHPAQRAAQLSEGKLAHLEIECEDFKMQQEMDGIE